MDDLTAPDRLTDRRLSTRPVISDRAILCLIVAIGILLLVGITREQWSQWVVAEPTVLYQCVGAEGNYYQHSACPQPIQYEVVRTIYDCQTPDNHWQQSSPCPVWRDAGTYAEREAAQPMRALGCEGADSRTGTEAMPCRTHTDDHTLKVRRKATVDVAPIELTLRPGASLDPCEATRSAQIASPDRAPASATAAESFAPSRSPESDARSTRTPCTN